MEIINKTKDKVIAENVHKPENIKEKVSGLLSYEDPEPIYFQTRWGIHTIGMNFSIDCMVMDKNMIVRKIKKNLRPGRLFIWNPKYNNVVELPPGTIDKTNTEILDKISFND